MNESYDEIINWLFNQIPMFQNVGADAYKPGLDTVTRLSDAFGSPHKRLKCIHIAGTNGKGSTASTLAAILTSAGYRTALYTSPHLVDFRERIRIDGEMIPHRDVIDFITRFRQLRFAPQPSFFELTTVMAFDYFARNDVDYAVIETGLGGRLDSTNIITPLISVITNISLDHTALLGDTPAKIAYEKAGIIKAGVPVVIGRSDDAVRQVFADKAAEERSPIDYADDSQWFDSYDISPDNITYHNTPWGTIRSELTGSCQPENANTVLHALRIFKPDIDAKAVAEGFANVNRLTGLTGRWSTVGTDPQVICDTGHNPGGWQYIAPRLEQIASQTQLHIVIGFVSDKDVESIFNMLPRKALYYFATPSVRRGRPSETLLPLAERHGLTAKAYPSVNDAYCAAKNAADQKDVIFVGGSTFIVADFLQNK